MIMLVFNTGNIGHHYVLLSLFFNSLSTTTLLLFGRVYLKGVERRRPEGYQGLVSYSPGTHQPCIGSVQNAMVKRKFIPRGCDDIRV